MPLDPKKISALREKVAESKDQDSALVVISPLDPKKSIPVILNILDDLVPLISDSDTSEFLAFAHKILNEADEKQNANLFQLHSVLKGLTKEKIDGDLGKLISYVKHIKINRATEKLWREAALWLEGIYRHTHDAAVKYYKGSIKPDKHGKIGPIDIEDQIFHGITGLTKYHVALYYHNAAQALYEKIDSELTAIKHAEVAKAAPQPSTKAEEKPKLEVKIIVEEKPREEKSREEKSRSEEKSSMERKSEEGVTQHAELHQESALFDVKKNNGIIQIILNITEDQSSKLTLIEETVKQILDGTFARTEPSSPSLDKTEPVKLEVGLTRLLETFKDEDVHVRISVLIYALDQFQLTKSEDLLIKQYLPIIISKLDAYSKAWVTANWVPNLFGRWHDSALTDANIDLKRDSKSNLKALFNLWVKIDAEGSKELYSKITGLLEGVYSILLKGSESQLMFASGGYL